MSGYKIHITDKEISHENTIVLDENTKIQSVLNIKIDEGSLSGWTIAMSEDMAKDFARILNAPAETYDETIKKSCLPNPIVDTIILTKGDENISMTVRAYQSNYGEGCKFIYWYVGCDIPYKPEPFKNHPLRLIRLEKGQTEIKETWGIVADNSLTRLILEYLMMSDQELYEKCGTLHQMEYRAMLINTLEILLD